MSVEKLRTLHIAWLHRKVMVEDFRTQYAFFNGHAIDCTSTSIYVCMRTSFRKCPRALIHWTVQYFTTGPRSTTTAIVAWILLFQCVVRHERIMLQFSPIILLRIAQKFSRLFSILFTTFFDIFTDL